MEMSEGNSFKDAMGRLRAGDQDAARALFERFVQRLTALAGTRLSAKMRRKVDPEDVVQSVFRGFFHRQAADQFQIPDWDRLWGLLATITIHKCEHVVEHFQAACRDVSAEDSSLRPPDESEAGWDVVARDPTPAQIAIFDETIVSLLHEFDERNGQIFLLVLQGWSIEEIANEIPCSERTARRVLDRVRLRLEELRDGLQPREGVNQGAE
jgi:RNA polymerase sigma factor (sigma-70 family)